MVNPIGFHGYFVVAEAELEFVNKTAAQECEYCFEALFAFNFNLKNIYKNNIYRKSV